MTVYRNTIETETSGSVQSLNRLSNAAESTTDRVARLDRQADQLGERAGKTASAAGMLGGVLGRINPEFEEGARVVADLADGLDVATMFGGTLLRVLGPIGVAAGVAAGAYMLLKQNLDAANEAMEQAAERANAMVELHQKVKEAALLAALAEETITQQQFNQAASARTAADAFQVQRNEREENLRLINQEIEATQKLVEEYGGQLARSAELNLSESDFQRVNAVTIRNLEEQAHKLARLNQQRTVAQTAVDVITTAEDQYAQSLEMVANRQQTATQRVKEGTAAIKVFAEEIDTLAEAFAALGFAMPSGDDLVGIGIDLNEPLIEMNTNLSDGLDLLARMIAARKELAERAEAEKQARISEMVEPVQTAGAAIQVAGGNLGAVQGLLPAGGAAAAMANPILGVLAGLEQIGSMGSEGVEERLDMMLENISAGIRALPSILIDVIPEFVFALVTELPAALADAIAEVFRRLLNLIPGVDIKEPGAPPSTVNEAVYQQLEQIRETQEQQAVGLVGATTTSASRSAAASTRGRMERADGATRLAMSRAPTSTMFGSGATIIQQALGFDSGSQDRFQRRFSQLTNSETGLRGRA